MYAAPGRQLLTRAVLTRIRDRLLKEREHTRKSPDHFIVIAPQIETTFSLKKQPPPNTRAVCCYAKLGVRLKVPFNSAWANKKYALAPCDWEHDALHFGPLRYDWHGHYLYRAATLRLRPSRTAQQVFSEAKSDADLAAGTAPARLEVAGAAAVAYTTEPPEAGKIRHLEVVGSKHNVLLLGFDNDLAFLKHAAQGLLR